MPTARAGAPGDGGGPPGTSKGKAAAGDGSAGNRRNDSERFFCPFPGCQRSFAELWCVRGGVRVEGDGR